MPNEFIDPYIDPKFGVLRNLVGATTYDELANAGWDINWMEVTGEENDYASKIAAETKDLSYLIKMFEQICYPCESNDIDSVKSFKLNHLRK